MIVAAGSVWNHERNIAWRGMGVADSESSGKSGCDRIKRENLIPHFPWRIGGNSNALSIV